LLSLFAKTFLNNILISECYSYLCVVCVIICRYLLANILIVLPVYNEEKQLVAGVNTLLAFLKKSKFPYTYTILIVDNASTDATLKIGKSLAGILKNVQYLRLEKKGRGLALRTAWRTAKKYACACYMDVDLSTDLKHLRTLIDAIVVQKYDLAVGNRLGTHSLVEGRTFFRELFSRTYNLLLRIVFMKKIPDAQCGFKAINPKSFLKIESTIRNNNWFFDTELLLIMYHCNMRVTAVDVHWVDDPDSQVALSSCILEYVRGILRMRFTLW